MNKLIVILLSSIILCTSLFAQQGSDKNKNGAEITFKNNTHDFGELKEGPKATYAFEFTNTGNEPLIITNCKASCHCTVTKCPKEPILPGETGFITALYNTKGRIGNFSKSVTITSNSKTPRKVIHIKGRVVKNLPTTPDKPRNMLNAGSK